MDDLDNLRDRFLIRASLCLSETVVTAAEKYITTADQYFSGSEDTVAVDEEQAFRNVAKGIRRANNKYTARLGRRR